MTQPYQPAPVSGSHAPRVSVIIPVRNGKAFIDEAIESVIEQSFKDFEIIIVDDGSDDDDYTRHANRDPRIRVARTSGKGVSFARNYGYSLSSGAYICFLDGDDAIAQGKLESQVRFLDQHPDFGFVFGKMVTWKSDEKGKFPPRQELLPNCSGVTDIIENRSGWRYEALICEEQIHVNTPMIRRAVLEKSGGFNEDMRIAEDQEWWIRLSRSTRMACLDAAVALYRIHPQSTMRRKLRAKNFDVEVRRQALKRWGELDPENRPISMNRYRTTLARFHFSHGVDHFRARNYAVALRSFIYPVTRAYRIERSLAYLMLSILLLPLGHWPKT
jgi:glycosyltransferase involved in cell wall biosynthesis